MFMDLRNVSKFAYGGTSSGKLLKFLNKDYHIKTGRMQVRKQNGFGIEPLIERIVYLLGKKLNINVAEEELGAIIYTHHGQEITTLANFSLDFKSENSICELEELTALTRKFIDFEGLMQMPRMNEKSEFLKLLYLDFVIMNEDRHMRNIAFFTDKNGLKLTPIYDNGYSCLYDDIDGLLENYENAARYCLCNAPIYGNTFANMQNLIYFYKDEIKDSGIAELNEKAVSCAVFKGYEEYQEVVRKYKINNIKLEINWAEKLCDFLNWRIKYVRDL